MLKQLQFRSYTKCCTWGSLFDISYGKFQEGSKDIFSKIREPIYNGCVVIYEVLEGAVYDKVW